MHHSEEALVPCWSVNAPIVTNYIFYLPNSLCLWDKDEALKVILHWVIIFLIVWSSWTRMRVAIYERRVMTRLEQFVRSGSLIGHHNLGGIFYL